MQTFGNFKIKWTYVTHRVEPRYAARVAPLSQDEDPGILVLARVLTIGRHKEVEDVQGIRRMLFPNDVIAGAMGHRYATDQYEGRASARGATGHLLGIGGVCGEVVSKNERMLDPTCLEWIGCLVDEEGGPLHLRRFALQPRRDASQGRPRTILAVGSAMNSGKTTSAAHVIRCLTQDGRRVSAAKVTGTACRKDPRIMEDAGAIRVLDFTHYGFPSTSRCPSNEILALAADIRATLLEDDPEFIVYEIADGVLQRETKILLEDPQFRSTIDAVLFTGADSISCEGGVRYLRSLGYNVVATAGIVANSQLGMSEVRAVTGIPCLSGQMILNGELKRALEVESSEGSRRT